MGIDGILKFKWYTVALFYMIAFLILSFIVASIWGWRKDIIDSNKVIPVNLNIIKPEEAMGLKEG